MGQAEVIEILKKRPNKWFTAEEISEFTEEQVNSVRRSVRKLRRTGWVELKERTNKHYYKIK